jgi:hypothetical protein
MTCSFFYEKEFHGGKGKPRESFISTDISRLSMELSKMTM